jgi:S-adenosyl methyltransferase
MGSIDNDPTKHPNSARIYDYLLGGSNNFAADRQAARTIVAGQPDMPLISQANRAFLRRAVRFFAEQGIEQYLDLGSGIPTVGSIHQVAHTSGRDAKVVYVDIDPVTVAHGQLLLRNEPNAVAIRGDMRRPLDVLADSELRATLQLDQPIAILMLASLHFVLDNAEALGIVACLRDAIAPGSFLAISHASYDHLPEDRRRDMEALSRTAQIPLSVRSRDEIARYFDGLKLVDPGVVHLPLWRPESPDDILMDDPPRSGVYCGVGRRSVL